MSNSSIFVLLIATVLGAGAVVASADAYAQDKTVKSKAAAESKKAPGKECGDLKPNSKEHKDCIAKQAKSEKAEKAEKAKAAMPAKKS